MLSHHLNARVLRGEAFKRENDVEDDLPARYLAAQYGAYDGDNHERSRRGVKSICSMCIPTAPMSYSMHQRFKEYNTMHISAYVLFRLLTSGRKPQDHKMPPSPHLALKTNAPAITVLTTYV